MPDTYLPASKRRIFGGEKRRHPVAQTLRDIAHGMNATANQATLRKAAELIDRMTNAEAQPGAVLRELVALKDLQERLLSLHEMGHGTDYGDFHKRNREAWAEASAFAASGQCRSDGRCQYAIDHGAEGMGHCPKGKCCMPLTAPDRAATAPATVAAFRADLLASLEEPTAEMLEAFQRGFLKQLQRRKHKGGESAELGGLRALLKVAMEAAALTTPDRAANSLAAPEPADVRIYWHAGEGWQVQWLTVPPNGGQSNYYRHVEPQPCRTDDRCQYAIDHGAEGMGHCPQGKCCMLLPEPAYKHIDGDTNDADLLWAEIHTLRAAVQGPTGYATWQDAATAERVRRVKAEKAQANVQVLVLTAVHHAVEACASATGQHRVIAHFVNKTHLANEVMEAVSSVAAEVRA